MLGQHETFIQYLNDQSILKGLGSRQKNNSKHLVEPSIDVEVPPETWCIMAILIIQPHQLEQKPMYYY